MKFYLKKFGAKKNEILLKIDCDIQYSMQCARTLKEKQNVTENVKLKIQGQIVGGPQQYTGIKLKN